MKNYLILIILLFSVKSIAQNATKETFQKNKYELALSYLKKSEYVKALDLFSVVSKIKPENEIGQESLKEIDTLKEILRKDILEKISGTWLVTGDKPIWTVTAHEDFKNQKVDKLVEVAQDKILFYEQDRKSKVKTLIKTEDLLYFNTDRSDSLYSAFILSDGRVWDCLLNEDNKVMRAINIAKYGKKGVKKITENNPEVYFVRTK
ncbi:hypothetical protein SAMN05444671_2363 [Flavobacterium sp. CF108]|jgi:hypothetical protein|uniref:hypothetical protein n=1 Tax=unclassified Flavobacterium TaxID=196869 RepID=UPI0008C91200|nr:MULTISPECIES: hypothetical protein [unclassified Flavobacterium]SEN89086.1 hypothetical protein SAMN04487978_1679 [Flavobacterium sp. fv08]SHH24009.1 hypothetical protein SAMN05444671_2363 [Flavobacterium sp. CF108]